MTKSVRLIQRMGRIDRLVHRTKPLKELTFGLAKNYEDYLRLKSRVANRMAFDECGGNRTGRQNDLEFPNEWWKKINYCQKQAQKMLEQLQHFGDFADGNGCFPCRRQRGARGL